MSAWHRVERQPEDGKTAAPNWRVVRDCIKAGRPLATFRPGHLPQ